MALSPDDAKIVGPGATDLEALADEYERKVDEALAAGVKFVQGRLGPHVELHINVAGHNHAVEKILCARYQAVGWGAFEFRGVSGERITIKMWPRG